MRDIRLGARADSYPAVLSGGQQQRVSIGRAMALNADLMLFDEPTSALDSEWVEEVLDLIRRVAERHQTMQIVTHEMQFAREIADRVIYMDGGRIVEEGPPAQIFAVPEDNRSRAFLRCVPMRHNSMSVTLAGVSDPTQPLARNDFAHPRPCA